MSSGSWPDCDGPDHVVTSDTDFPLPAAASRLPSHSVKYRKSAIVSAPCCQLHGRPIGAGRRSGWPPAGLRNAWDSESGDTHWPAAGRRLRVRGSESLSVTRAASGPAQWLRLRLRAVPLAMRPGPGGRRGTPGPAWRPAGRFVQVQV